MDHRRLVAAVAKIRRGFTHAGLVGDDVAGDLAEQVGAQQFRLLYPARPGSPRRPVPTGLGGDPRAVRQTSHVLDCQEAGSG
jgi:hypothetical protein